MNKIDIFVRTSIHNNSRVGIGICFRNADVYGLIAISMRVVCANGDIHNLLSNRLVYISNNPSFWNDSMLHTFHSSPLKAIVEIHSFGKLLYIQSFALNNNSGENKIYLLNTDVRWRKENSLVISVFNTNGNLLFLKGIYKDLWEILTTPTKPEEIVDMLMSKGYEESKIKSSINSLIKRGLILEESKENIDYI